jgi:hypothetical protein
VSPGGGGLDNETPPGVSWASGFKFFFLSHFLTVDAPAPSLTCWEEPVCLFEACIHASEGAQVPHDHVG